MDFEGQSVPLLPHALQSRRLKDGDAVRFRGMIQDMHDPEFYFETYEVFDKITKRSRLASGKYRDTGDIGENECIDYNSAKLKSAERLTVSVVSLPALNEWARRAERARDLELHPPPSIEATATSNNRSAKRSLEEEDDDGAEDSRQGSGGVKRRGDVAEATNDGDGGVPPVSMESVLNLPLPDKAAQVCSIKVYEDFESLKLNDMVEITGYLSIDPALGEFWNRCGDADLETLVHNPPPSLVPRIHATKIEKLSHCNPLLDDKFDAENLMTNAGEARDSLRTVLTQALFGDELAAEYLICNLISRVYIRRDVLTLGKFSLNLWKIPSVHDETYTSRLYGIISKCVTKSHYLPVTVDDLNTLSFVPKKDYETNRLISGILQLSQNTHLVVDETKMQPGKLDASGIANMASLCHVVENQIVKYNFKFYEMDYSCDIPVLILSEGKTLFSSDFSIPLVIDEEMLKIRNEIFEAADHYLSESILNKIRTYITTLQLADYHISDEPKYVQEDFIAMRKENTGREVKEEDLHNLLVLTRLLCLSKGFNTINQECWNLAKTMEEQRYERLKLVK